MQEKRKECVRCKEYWGERNGVQRLRGNREEWGEACVSSLPCR